MNMSGSGRRGENSSELEKQKDIPHKARNKWLLASQRLLLLQKTKTALFAKQMSEICSML